VVVEERLAAAANVVHGATSIYWWQGTLAQAREALLIFKTRAELIEPLTSSVAVTPILIGSAVCATAPETRKQVTVAVRGTLVRLPVGTTGETRPQVPLPACRCRGTV
jgi:hypothetical protein